MSADKDKVSQLAYQIWQEEGCPEGQDMEHWLRAEAMAGGAVPAPVPVKSAKAKGPAKPKAPAKAVSKAKAKSPAKV